MKQFPLIKMAEVPESEEAKSAIGFKYNKSFVSKHQLGGMPEFIQGEDWPICNCCKQKMSFYAQLDSVGDNMCIADCGMIYVFLCFDCYESKSIVQSY